MATRPYEKDGFAVFWDSTRCIHTGICLRSLHSVFNLKNRPWVNLDGGDVEQIIATVEKCPTGALRYSSGGDLRVVDPETGGVIAEETRVALCRCGKSENQPFCDNSHRRIHFIEASHIESSARADARSPADICPPQDFALE